MAKKDLFGPIPLVFDGRFLQDHAGHIITDPRIAIVELIANAYDAGATKVQIEFPKKIGETLRVEDNGTGLTVEQFNERWRTLNYDRTKHQGTLVVFPADLKSPPRRTALGQSGKGRLAPFCYADKYLVDSFAGGKGFQAQVELASGGMVPFTTTLVNQYDADGHGTIVTAVIDRRRLDPSEIGQLIGSKFIVDPSFGVWVNGDKIQLLDLAGIESQTLTLPGGETIEVHFIESTDHPRSAKLRGITWWVYRRMVGEPGWDRLDTDGAYLDGRTEHAKRFSFIVEADILKPAVKGDWTGFHMDPKVQVVQDAAHEFVLNKLREKEAGTRREKKLAALERSKTLLGGLPAISKKLVGQFVDEVQEKCPTMSERDLERTVNVLANLENSRGGYDLLAKLEACSPTDLDLWNDIMQQWSAENATVVLSELERRLQLIGRMKKLVGNPNSDELHDLQPLFERGLWIFGPEYEAVDFRSNRGLTEIIGGFLRATPVEIKGSRRRPDFVVLPDRNIGAYSADSYSADNEVSGLRKVIIIELKRAGIPPLSQKEIDQARDYALEIRNAGKVQRDTQIVAYVLGDKMEASLEENAIGKNINIIPMVYDTILRKAHARTFNLQERLREAPVLDAEVEHVLNGADQQQLF